MSAYDVSKPFGLKSGCQNVGPDMGHILWTLIVFPKFFHENFDFEKPSADNNENMNNYPICKELNLKYKGNICIHDS